HARARRSDDARRSHRRDVGAARTARRFRRDALAAQPRQPDHRTPRLRRDHRAAVEDAARRIVEDDCADRATRGSLDGIRRAWRRAQALKRLIIYRTLVIGGIVALLEV